MHHFFIVPAMQHGCPAKPLYTEAVSKSPKCDYLNLTNRKWFSVVCTLIGNDIGHHSGQNVLESRGAAE